MSLSPVETPLPRLQCKRVSSLITKVAVEIVNLLQDQGGFYSHYFLATKHTGGFCPILNLRGLNSLYELSSSTWKPSPLFCRVFTKVGGWCRWIPRTPICMCRYTPVTGAIFGLLSGTKQWNSLSINGKFSLLA